MIGCARRFRRAFLLETRRQHCSDHSRLVPEYLLQVSICNYLIDDPCGFWFNGHAAGHRFPAVARHRNSSNCSSWIKNLLVGSTRALNVNGTSNWLSSGFASGRLRGNPVIVAMPKIPRGLPCFKRYPLDPGRIFLTALHRQFSVTLFPDSKSSINVLSFAYGHFSGFQVNKKSAS